MLYLRSFTHFFLFSLSSIVFSIAIIFAAPFARSITLSSIANRWGLFNLFLLKIICHLDYRLSGLENLPTHAGFIILAKHQSTWETVALRGLLPPNQSWVLKRELLSYPLFGMALKLTGQIAIDRKAGKRALSNLIEQGSNAIARGQIVVIFPEGTRTLHGERSKYNIGGAILAEQCDAHTIPIAHNAGLFWPRNTWVKYPGTIEVVIGKAICNCRQVGAKNLIVSVEEWIESTIKQIPQHR